MVNSVGKKLQQSRLAKQLSIEEAARVTRIRPDKLLDLEEDNYSNFPSMSYAKGFLLLYARFLGVDVREFADSLHAPNPVSTDDYEYLNAAASSPAPAASRREYHFSQRRERNIILPVVVFAVLAGAIAFGVYVVVSFQRLGDLDDIADKKSLASPSPGFSPAISALTPIPAPAPVPAVVPATPAPALRSAPPAIVAAPPVPGPASPAPAVVQPPLPPAAPAGTFDPTREVRRAEPVFPTPPSHTEVAPPGGLPAIGSGPAVSTIVPVSTPESVKQLSIRPIRKTMVTIRKDVAGSAPIFEDWLYPGDGPLKVSGHKFWIQVQDPGAVQITQDGQPVGTGQTDIQIE